MVRDKIILYLDSIGTTGHYQQLKDCFILQPGTETTDGAVVDEWFKGIIESLYYKPNKNVLVLVGPMSIGKTYFIKHLLPKELCNYPFTPDIYTDLIYHFDDTFEKKHLWLANEDNFKVDHDECDKRLASYCVTTNFWYFPKRKNYIILRLQSIDLQRYNSIDKTELWIEIFNKFKHK